MTHAIVSAPSGIRYPIWQKGTGTPLLLLHGFTGSSATWQHLVAPLSQDHRVTTLDLPGHGLSNISSAQPWSFTSVVDDLAWVIESQLGGAAVVLGYSMGGRLALGLAISHPERVRNLILESTSPGIRDEAERRSRQQADEQLAERILTDGVESFVARWERLPMWDSQISLPDSYRQRQRQIRLEQNPAGLAANLRATGTGVQPSYWDQLADMNTPALLIAGELDSKFVQVVCRMHEFLPESRLEIVPEAGHAVHLEKPDRYVELVLQFLEQPARVRIDSQRSKRD